MCYHKPDRMYNELSVPLGEHRGRGEVTVAKISFLRPHTVAVRHRAVLRIFSNTPRSNAERSSTMLWLHQSNGSKVQDILIVKVACFGAMRRRYLAASTSGIFTLCYHTTPPALS